MAAARRSGACARGARACASACVRGSGGGRLKGEWGVGGAADFVAATLRRRDDSPSLGSRFTHPQMLELGRDGRGVSVGGGRGGRGGLFALFITRSGPPSSSSRLVGSVAVLARPSPPPPSWSSPSLALRSRRAPGGARKGRGREETASEERAVGGGRGGGRVSEKGSERGGGAEEGRGAVGSARG